MLYLINYLGTFFLWTFIIFQVTTCVAVFLVISPILSQDKMSLFQRIISSVCFAMMAYHYTSVLYFITMTVEKAHEDLKMLSTSLKQVLLIENDVMKKESLKILIKEVENVRPLGGNGYFTIGRSTLTSMLSISVTYFIILLQFRTG